MVLLAALVLSVSVSGTVVDDRGRPVADAEVRWADGSRPVAMNVDGLHGQGKVVTDAEGRFALTGLPANAVVMAQVADHMFSGVERVPRSGGRLVLTVARMQRVRGRLRLAGKPPADASLLDHSKAVDADGRFDFFLTTNLTEIDVDGEGFARRALPVKGEPGAITDFGDVVLEPGASLEIVVMRDGGIVKGSALEVRPLPWLRAQQRLAREHPEQWREDSFSFDPMRLQGHLFSRLAPGRYGVWAEPDVAYSELTLGKVAEQHVVPAVEPAVLVVTDASSGRELDPTVMPLDCAGHAVRVKLSGKKAEQPIAPGTCYLPAVTQTFEGGRRTVTLESGKRTEVKLVDVVRK